MRPSPKAPDPPGDHRWPRRLRLRKRKDFAQVQRAGARAGGPLLVVLVRKTRAQDAAGRMGFAVSKKVGNAPVRNLVKRRLRHLSRTQKALWQGLDVVLLVQPPAANATFDALAAAFVDGLGRARRALDAGKGKGGRKRRGAKAGAEKAGGGATSRTSPPKR